VIYLTWLGKIALLLDRLRCRPRYRYRPCPQATGERRGDVTGAGPAGTVGGGTVELRTLGTVVRALLPRYAHA
jgi:hypothetical protein